MCINKQKRKKKSTLQFIRLDGDAKTQQGINIQINGLDTKQVNTVGLDFCSKDLNNSTNYLTNE